MPRTPFPPVLPCLLENSLNIVLPPADTEMRAMRERNPRTGKIVGRILITETSNPRIENADGALPVGVFDRGKPGESPASPIIYLDNTRISHSHLTQLQAKYNTCDEKNGSVPPPESPVSVNACYNKAWTLRLWKRDNPAGHINVPFTCRSWRHPGPCREWKGSQDFVRIREALKKHEDWVYMVLTFKHRRKNVRAVYKRIVKQWQNFRQAIKRRFSKNVPLEYITLMEQHKDGYPHVNIIMYSPDLVAAAKKDWRSLREILKPHAKSTGFSDEQFWIEPVRDKEAMAGYFNKLCGEVSKFTQAPMAAPKNFRRLRSSHDLLPPAHKSSGEYTGELVTIPADRADKCELPNRVLDAMHASVRMQNERGRRVEGEYIYDKEAKQKLLSDVRRLSNSFSA